MSKFATLALAFLITFSHSALAMQPPCSAGQRTKEQNLSRFDNVVVLKVNSSKDESVWFSELIKKQNTGTPEEQKLAEDVFVAYVTHKATVMESFKGSLKGEINIAEIRNAFTVNSTAPLVPGFIYILGIDNPTGEISQDFPKDMFVMSECSNIFDAPSDRNGDFMEKLREYRN